MKGWLITLSSTLLLAGCAGGPGWQKSADGRAEALKQEKFVCAHQADREAGVHGVYGGLPPSGDRRYSWQEPYHPPPYYSQAGPFFRDPYFDPGNVRFRNELYRQCLQRRVWRPGEGGG